MIVSLADSILLIFLISYFNESLSLSLSVIILENVFSFPNNQKSLCPLEILENCLALEPKLVLELKFYDRTTVP